MPPPAPERAYIALGANLGDARAALAHASDELARLPGSTRVAVSSVYRSAPVDAAGPDYLNAVVAIDTTLRAVELLGHLHAIEHAHGRQRSHRNAPRTLDLDLLLLGNAMIDTPTLTVPHPRLHQRAFVLLPLLELAPELELPGLGPAAAFLPGVRDQAIQRLDQR
jgi:2-amino-4-hydroxy-6-hydroxymethyldihydropteridine diphosphokinase